MDRAIRAPSPLRDRAGTKRANGFYMQDGTRNGKPRYRKIGDPDLQLLETTCCADEWVISRNAADGKVLSQHSHRLAITPYRPVIG